MTRRALALAVALCAVAPAARAEQDDAASARERYARGQELFSSGDYQAALVEFEAAYEAQPHPVVLKSQANCHEQLGQYRDAVRLLRQYLDERPTASDRAEVEERIASLSTRPATVRIETTPPGAHVTLDGNRLGEVTPLTTEVSPGDHALAIELAGYEMVLRELSVEFGDARTVEVALEPMATSVGAGPSDGSGDGAEDAGDAAAEASSVRVSTPVWIMVGVAGAGLLTGIVSGSLALADQGDFDDGVAQDLPRSDLEEIGDGGTTKALVADIAFGVAGAAAIAGIVLFFVQNARDDADEASALSISPTAAPGGGGVSAALRF